MLAARAFHHAWELAENNPRRALILYNEARSLEQAAGHECDARARYEQFLRDADGSMPEAQERIGQARDRLAELDARVGAERCGGEASASEASPGGEGISPVGPIVIGVGAAMLIASAITGGLALATQSDLTAACGQDMHCPEASLGRVGDLRALALTTDVMLPVGAAVAIVGVLLTLLLHDGPAETPVTAWVGPNGAGAVLRGSM